MSPDMRTREAREWAVELGAKQTAVRVALADWLTLLVLGNPGLIESTATHGLDMDAEIWATMDLLERLAHRRIVALSAEEIAEALQYG